MITPLTMSKKILVCAGPGGVGKTTTAAALGAMAARAGRRTVVCTIDPAPRLADALGIPALGAEPRPLSDEANRALGIEGPGSLHAARLDTSGAFARLVEEKVTDREMKRRIYGNPIYRQITSTLTGSQEYAATLALYDLHREGRFDLIVLDTPPTANALDFLEAPGRIAKAVTSPAIGWFARPASGVGLLSLQRLRAGGALILRRLAKFVGSEFLDDIGAFLLDFRDVLGGFLERANAIEALLRHPDVGFLLVLAPETAAVAEALYFADRLKASGIPLDGFVANRMAPPPGASDRGELRDRLAAAAPVLPATTLDGAADALAATAAYLEGLAAAQRQEISRLQRSVPGVPITTVPLLPQASTLTSLRLIGDRLAGVAA